MFKAFDRHIAAISHFVDGNIPAALIEDIQRIQPGPLQINSGFGGGNKVGADNALVRESVRIFRNTLQLTKLTGIGKDGQITAGSECIGDGNVADGIQEDGTAC